MASPKYIHVPILNDEYSVVIYFGGEAEANSVATAVGHTYTDMDWRSARGYTIVSEGITPVIAMPQRPTTFAEFATLAHEACHAVEAIFNHIGQPVGDEIFAHSVGAVVRAAGNKPQLLHPAKKRKK